MLQPKLRGMTLLEVLLVIVIGIAILILGFRQYQNIKAESDFQIIQYNVDTLFSAMSLYFQANCSQGTLSPSYLSPQKFSTPFPISINNDLMNPTYAYLTVLPKASSLVSSTNGWTSYIVQFNPQINIRQMTPNQTGNNLNNNLGMALIWTIQVAVHMKSNTGVQTYANILDAACISSMQNGMVTSCNSNPTPGKYIVFQRLPSWASPNSLSNYWTMNPQVKLFKQLYTTAPFQYLMNSQGYSTQGNMQYYLCNG
jgi:type II secretory pathway pseudopilin PulG